MAEVHPRAGRRVIAHELGRAQDRAVAAEDDDELDAVRSDLLEPLTAPLSSGTNECTSSQCSAAITGSRRRRGAVGAHLARCLEGGLRGAGVGHH
jgi:hypothetical protein